VLDFARAKLRGAYPDFLRCVSFAQVDSLSEARFDCIISKDSFEHYADPEGYIQRMRDWLVPGGRIYIGFAPLWKSPFGGHMGMVTPLPWVHLLFSEQVLLERRAQLTGEAAQCYSDVSVSGGLNRMTLQRFRKIVRMSGCRVLFFRANHSNRPFVPMFNLFRRLPGCEEYFTVNAYAVLETPKCSCPQT
jgi:SAM-dependent methyltransferase